MKCSTKKIQRHNDVLRHLHDYAHIQRKNIDEAGWIALIYSCTNAQAEKMIADARSYDAARKEAEKEAS